MNINDLSRDQLAKLDECKTPEELLSFAKSEEFELSDEDLDQISGGSWDDDDPKPTPQVDVKCPYCGSTSVAEHRYYYECVRCYRMWNSPDEV